MHRRIVYIILSSFFYINVIAQNYNIQHYTVKDGLLHSFVSDITQDNYGNIWIATGGGVSKFNGVEFTNYTTKDGLNYPRILSLGIDSLNQIWVGSSGGLNVFDGNKMYSTNLNENILVIKKALDGKMWVLSNSGLKKIQLVKGKFNEENFPCSFKEENYINIFQDRSSSFFLVETAKDKLFIGYKYSVYLYQDHQVRKISFNQNIQVYSACKLENGQIIFGTNEGLMYYRNDSLQPFENSHLNNFQALKIKRKNSKIWMIGKWGNVTDKELYLVSIDLNDSLYFRKISVQNGLIDNPTSLFIDHENNVWTGSDGGINVLKGESFVNYTEQSGIVGNKVWGVYQDRQNKIWMGTISQGMSIIDGETILNFTIKEGLPDMYIGTFHQSPKNDNIMYFGTAHQGLCTAIYDPKTHQYRFHQLDIPLNKGETRIDDIIEDDRHTLWIASSKGLFYSNDENVFSHYELFTGDTAYTPIQKLCLASDGQIYVGTKKDGLYAIRNNYCFKILNDMGIISVCEDMYSEIWVASQLKGILNISNNRFEWINEKNGLNSNLIYILQSDSYGNLWVGSNLGLDKLNIIKYHITGKIEAQHYGIDDGLNAQEMNLNGSIEDRQHNLWFATNNGLLKYDYRYDISNQIAPKLSITNLKLFSRTVNWKQYSDSILPWSILPVNPVLPYNQNHITFEFIGISFKNPNKIKYIWKLDGFDENWVPISSNRQAIYSNLPSGEYTFEVKSSNSDGVWNKKSVLFSFTITPPFWVTWWFITLAGLFVLLVFVAVVRLRIRSLKKHQIELRYLVENRTKELLEQKNEIEAQRNEIEAQRDTVTIQKQELERIHKELRDSIFYAKRIQNAILPDLALLEEKFDKHFVFFKSKDIVSGDFFWWSYVEVDNSTVMTVADCTGHGIPGGFMSMLGISFLREIVNKEYISHPGVILRKLRKDIIRSLRQKGEEGEQKDGMDMSLISVNHDTLELQYAGANNPIYIIRSHKSGELKGSLVGNIKKTNAKENTLYEIQPDKMPIAIYDRMDKFTTHKIQLIEEDQVYLFSDGYADQFGGPNNKKFKYKPLKQLLIDNAHKSMSEQKEILNQTFMEWKRDNEQVDDVTILGIKI